MAAGTTAKRITDWCNQGHILGQREHLGKGCWRKFSFSNVLVIAGAVALMDAGVRSPADAFKAAGYFSHIADSDVWDNGSDTFMAVSGDMYEVVHGVDGTVNTYSIFPMMRRPAGFILLNMSAVFAQVMHRLEHGDIELEKIQRIGND